MDYYFAQTMIRHLIGYISFDDNGLIIISDELDDINRVFLNLRQDMSIKLTDGNREYLKYHRKNIFILKR